jgi:DNA-binding MarR family transcriptional regulator
MGTPEAAATASELRLVIGQLVRRMRDDAELPPRLGAVLGTLDRDGPATTSDLAVAQRMRPQSMASTIGELVARGCVQRRPHPTDGRKLLIELSDVGRDALRAQREQRVGWLAGAIAEQFTPAERAALADSVELLRRLADA